MAKKEFTYRGKTLEELQAMSLKELAALLPSRQRRKISRGFTPQEKIFLEKLASSNDQPVKTHCRDMLILPLMVGRTIRIHRGNEFVPLIIMPEMIGQRFGEMILSRKKVNHQAPGVGATKSSGGAGAK